MSAINVIGTIFYVTLLYELVDLVWMCTYKVESRRPHDKIQVDLNDHVSSRCELFETLKDRWVVEDGDETAMLRIRASGMKAKYRTVTVRYTCLESRGHTFLLGTTDYWQQYSYGVLCLGFVQVTSETAEYLIMRLNEHGPEQHLLSPQPVQIENDTLPSLNETCDPIASDVKTIAHIRRRERRCMFPEEIQHAWNYTYHTARDVMFAKKTFVLNHINGSTFTFDCSLKDGDLYVLRLRAVADSDFDGILCMNITRLIDDPHYKYEMTRLNSGRELEDQLALVPSGKSVSFKEECNWLDSPSRPEYLY